MFNKILIPGERKTASYLVWWVAVISSEPSRHLQWHRYISIDDASRMQHFPSFSNVAILYAIVRLLTGRLKNSIIRSAVIGIGCRSCIAKLIIIFSHLLNEGQGVVKVILRTMSGCQYSSRFSFRWQDKIISMIQSQREPTGIIVASLSSN